MKILLDTHILIWALNDDMKLSNKAKNKIYNGNNEIFYSPLSIYEIESKREKHPERMPVTGEEIIAFCEEAGFKVLPFKENHAITLENLQRPKNAPPHNDPFDRMLICQAIAENMLFMTHDERIAEYDTPNVFKV